MRVVAFSCCHIARPETQMELYNRHLDYGPVKAFIAMLLAEPPDYLVNLGDFTEPYYDPENYYREVVPEYDELIKAVNNSVRLEGNHDPDGGPDHCMIDGIKYEHGHRDFRSRHVHRRFASPEAYNEHVREGYKDKRLVHGHTHIPQEAWPLDVGSVTHSRTYGEIVDGKPYLREL